MSVLKFSVGRSGAGGANSDYITRLTAAEAISFHNLNHLKSEELGESRINAIAYAHAREEIELAKNAKARTHYRIIISWEGKETSEKAALEVDKYLEKQFPGGRAIVAVHQNTDDTHAHVWLETRQTDGRKIQMDRQKYGTLDERWTEQYDEAYGTNYAPGYKALKEETKQYKRDMYEWRKAQTERPEEAQLTPEPVKPIRAADRMKIEYWRAKEIQEVGALKQTPEIVPAVEIHEIRKNVAADSFKNDAENYFEPHAEKLTDISRNNQAQESKEKPPVQPPAEKGQIIERQVESYMLDLKQMMARQREDLIKEVMRTSYRSMTREGVPMNWDKMREITVQTVDRITEDGAHHVRDKIRSELQQGSHLREQISVDNKYGGEAVQQILQNAADDSHRAIVEQTLDVYRNHIQEKTVEAGKYFADKTASLYHSFNAGAIKNEESGLGSGQPIIEGRDRSSERTEQTSAGTKRLDDGTKQNDGGTSRAVDGAERAAQRSKSDSDPAAVPIDEENIGIGTNPRRDAVAGHRNDDARSESRESISESAQDAVDLTGSENEFATFSSLYDVRDEGFQPPAGNFEKGEDPGEKLYRSRLQESVDLGKSSLEGLSGLLETAGIPETESVGIYETPAIRLSAPSIVPDTKLIADFKGMMNQSLQSQRLGLSDRAEFILNNQLRTDAATPAVSIITNSIAIDPGTGQNTVEKQLTEHTSKLEIEYDRLKSMEDKSARDEEFRKLAVKMEDRAEDQREQGVDLGVYSDEWQREEMYQSL